jgi:hypothetical protein
MGKGLQKGRAMLVAQHMFFADRIVELINIYGHAFIHKKSIPMFYLKIKHAKIPRVSANVSQCMA